MNHKPPTKSDEKPNGTKKSDKERQRVPKGEEPHVNTLPPDEPQKAKILRQPSATDDKIQTNIVNAIVARDRKLPNKHKDNPNNLNVVGKGRIITKKTIAHPRSSEKVRSFAGNETDTNKIMNKQTTEPPKPDIKTKTRKAKPLTKSPIKMYGKSKENTQLKMPESQDNMNSPASQTDNENMANYRKDSLDDNNNHNNNSSPSKDDRRLTDKNAKHQEEVEHMTSPIKSRRKKPLPNNRNRNYNQNLLFDGCNPKNRN